MADRSAPATPSHQPTAEGIPSPRVSRPPSEIVDRSEDGVNEKRRSSNSTDLEAGSVTIAEKSTEAPEKKEEPVAPANPSARPTDPNLVTWDSPTDPYAPFISSCMPIAS